MSGPGEHSVRGPGERPGEAPGAMRELPEGLQWPTITIVTPSYNQGSYIERTIRSVLEQGYPRLEYVVIDGGSTDGTVETIRRLEGWIDYWVSQADRGQSHAINKGMARATGEVCGWLNSDDLLLPGALHAIGSYFARHPECQWLGGTAVDELPDGRLRVCPAGLAGPAALLEFWRFGSPGHYMKQSSIFWRRSLWEAVGGLREDLHLAMDHDLWLRFAERAEFHVIPDRLSLAQLHPDCKSLRATRQQAAEAMRCCYDAADRRGMGRRGLTLRFLRQLPAWRLGRCVRSARDGWWGGVVRNLMKLPLDPVRIWSEEGRMTMIRGRRRH